MNIDGRAKSSRFGVGVLSGVIVSLRPNGPKKVAWDGYICICNKNRTIGGYWAPGPFIYLTPERRYSSHDMPSLKQFVTSTSKRVGHIISGFCHFLVLHASIFVFPVITFLFVLACFSISEFSIQRCEEFLSMFAEAFIFVVLLIK